MRSRAYLIISAMTCLLAGMIATHASAHGFEVIHNFTNGSDGGVPPYTLVLDKKGRLLGTANQGGTNEAGIIFRVMHKKSGWLLTPIYNFSGTDG